MAMDNLNNKLLAKIMDIGLIIGIIIVVIIVVIGILQKEKIKEPLKKNKTPLAKDTPNYDEDELDNDLLDLIVNLNKIIN